MSSEPLLRSAIPGRERWQIASLQRQPRYAAAVERELAAFPSLAHAYANPVTGRLLVHYDAATPPREMRDSIDAALAAAPMQYDELAAWRQVWPRGYSRSVEDRAVAKATARFAIAGGIFGGLLVKRLIWGAGSLAGSPLLITIGTVSAVISGYDLLRKGFDRLFTSTPITGGDVLEGVSLGLLVAAESFEGVAALAARELGELLFAKGVRETHRVAGGIVLPRDRAINVLEKPALVASTGALLVTHDPSTSLAMLVGAMPEGSSETKALSMALAIRAAARDSIYFRELDALLHEGEFDIAADPSQAERVDELRREVRSVMRQNDMLAILAGIGGLTAAMFGALSPVTAATYHNRVRLLLQASAARLALA